jgi:hypothetical protein
VGGGATVKATEVYAGTLSVEVCITCGIAFGMPGEYMAQRRRNHKSYFCPNGHSQFYPGQSDEERLTKQLAAAEGNAKYYRERVVSEVRSKNAYKGQATRAKRAAAKGDCPCCGKNFGNLREHMEHKHPDFVADAGNTDVTP